MYVSRSLTHQRGFTLIEFVVASALGLLLSVVVASLYFYTNRLNHVAQTRLDVQEELRQLSHLINQDASLAGNFGCLSLTSLYQKDSRNTDNKFFREFHVFSSPNVQKNGPILFDRPGESAQTNNQNFGVNLIPANQLAVPNFQGQGEALVFYYGLGNSALRNIDFGHDGSRITSLTFQDGDPNRYLASVANQGGYLAIASCQTLNVFKSPELDTHEAIHLPPNSFGDVRISFDEATNHHSLLQISLLRYIVHAYVVGVANGQAGLYKIELNETGHWGPPVLVSRYVHQMQVSFAYPTTLNKAGQPVGCPSAFNDDLYANDRQTLEEKFNDFRFYEKDNATFTQTHAPTNRKQQQGVDLSQPLKEELHYQPPVGVNVVLTVVYPKLGRPFGLGVAQQDRSLSNEDSRVSLKSGEGENTKVFRIFSSIRGGNQCASRNLID
ncbi:MAG: prepilin-type N-terminal cleavage/methylation domain-containing protein [Neisseriaceae bacterium]